MVCKLNIKRILNRNLNKNLMGTLNVYITLICYKKFYDLNSIFIILRFKFNKVKYIRDRAPDVLSLKKLN